METPENQKIILPLKYKGIRYNQFFALFYILLSAMGFYYNPTAYLFNFGFSIIGCAHIYLYFFYYANARIEIANNIVFKKPFGKSVNLNEITEFKKFAGDYTLKSDSSKIIINTQLLDEDDLQNLDRILECIPEKYQREILA